MTAAYGPIEVVTASGNRDSIEGTLYLGSPDGLSPHITAPGCRGSAPGRLLAGGVHRARFIPGHTAWQARAGGRPRGGGKDPVGQIVGRPPRPPADSSPVLRRAGRGQGAV